MPNRHRIQVSLFVLAITLLVGAHAPAPAAQLSDEALMLLPADAMALVVYSSLDEIDQRLLVPLREVADPGDVADIQVMEMLPDELKALADAIDRSRPLVQVFSLGMQHGPPEPVQMVLVPVLEGADPETLALVSGYASAEAIGDYVALSQDPNYQASGAVPALAKNLPEGQIVGRADLESFIAVSRPMAEMMLSSMEQMAEQDPSSEGLPAPMVSAIRGFMDSARVGEFSIEETGGELEFFIGLDVFAGSMLDVGPQPPLETALKLAGHLPDYGELMTVTAMDLSMLYANMPFLREPSMMQMSKAMTEPKSEAAIAWWTTADELSRPFERAAASTARFHGDGFEFVEVAQLENAAEQMEKITAHLALLPEAQLGFVLNEEASETRGDMSYHRYSWDFDPEQLMSMVGEDPEDELPDAEEMDEFTAFLRVMLPPLHLAALPDRALMVLMPEGAELDAVLERFTASPQMPPMALEGLRSWSGDEVELIAQVELRALVREIMEYASKLNPEESYEIADGEPVRIRYAVEAGEIHHDARLQTRTGALLRFIKELDEMEEDDDAVGYDTGPDSGGE